VGLSIVSAGFELRKNYLLRQGGESVYSKIDFANSAWGLEEQIDSLEGEDFRKLYKRAATENIALMFAKPKDSTQKSFIRATEALTPQRVKECLFDVEWFAEGASPALQEPLQKHGIHILSTLGFQFPQEVRFFIRRSSSCGVINYEDKGKPYRFHLWVWLDEAIEQRQLADTLAKHSLLDSSFYSNLTQPVFIKEGVLGRGVKRQGFDDEDFYNEGREVSISEIAKLEPAKKFVREQKAAGISNGRQSLANSYNRIQLWYKDKLPLSDYDELYSVILKYAKAGKLNGHRNEDLAWIIDHDLKRSGNADKALDFITSHPEVQRDWTETQLKAKVRGLRKNRAELRDFGGLPVWFEPDKTISLDLRDISQLTDLSLIPSAGVVLIKSPEGSGKTELIQKVFQREQSLSEKQIRLLNVNYRQAPIGQLAEEWGIDSYLTVGKDVAEEGGLTDRERKERFCPESNQLAIGCLSLPHLLKSKGIPEAYDIVFLDEIEHILHSLTSGKVGLFGEEAESFVNTSRCYEALKEICKRATLVIGADASATGIGAGLFSHHIACESDKNKTLIQNNADFIADKEIIIYKSKAKLVADLAKEAHSCSYGIAVHTSFGNDTEERKLNALKKTLVKLGVEERSIFLAYPSLFKGRELEDTYKTNPKKIIPELYDQGKRTFINSPFNGVAWSSKDERFETAYGLFDNGYLSADDIKQFVRRFRMVKTIRVYISNQSKNLNDVQIKAFIERLKNGFDTLHDFQDLNERCDLVRKIQSESIASDFRTLCENGGASVGYEGAEDEATKTALDEAFDETVKKELRDYERFTKETKNFEMLSGHKIHPAFLQDNPEELRKMLRYDRLDKDGISLLLEMWRDPKGRISRLNEVSNSSKQRKQIALLNLKMLDAIDKDFERETTETFRAFLLNRDKTELRIDKHDEAFRELATFLNQNKESIDEAFFKFLKVNEIAPRVVLGQLCKVFFLNLNAKAPTFQSYNTSKTACREILSKRYALKKSLGLKGRNAFIDEKVSAKALAGSRLTKEEDAWLCVVFPKIIISKNATQPIELRSAELPEPIHEI